MPALPPRFPPESLDLPSDPEDGRMVAQGRLVDVVADGTVLRGTPATLARQLGISAGDLLGAIEELMAIGWVMFEVGPQGELTVRWIDDLPRNRSPRRRGDPVGRRALTGRRRTEDTREAADGGGRPTHAVTPDPPRSRPASTRARLATPRRHGATMGTPGVARVSARGGADHAWPEDPGAPSQGAARKGRRAAAHGQRRVRPPQSRPVGAPAMPGGRGPAAELVARIPVELAYRLGLLVPPSDD